MSRYRWRLYVGHGRRKFRLGVWRHRRDRWSPEYRFLQVENHLW
jgi:hypothetical protein